MDVIIYHYCSAQAFQAIIQSKMLFLTDVTTMNDTMECEWCKNIIYAELKKFLSCLKGKDMMNDILMQTSFNLRDRFICCFSEEGDLLSQWRAYADDGRGFAIGFSINEMGLLQSLPMTHVDKKYSTGLCKVVYDESEQRKSVADCIQEIISGKDYINCVARMAQLSTIFKNPAFEEEQEWRIVHTPLILNDDKDVKIIGAVSDYDFRITKFGMSPYFRWAFPDENSSLIKEIIMGPQNMTTENNLSFFLHKMGLKNVEIKRSRASYRS